LESMLLSRESMKERVHSALCHWGLEKLRTSSAQELSGGERKRVLLAVMEAIDARLWLLDEAFDDLDEHWRITLKQMIKETDKTVLVFASRYLSTFDDLFDRMLLLEDKKILSYPSQDLLSRFAFLCKDTLPNPLEHQELDIQNKHLLTVDTLRIERKRISTISIGSFHLDVDDFSLQSGELVTLVAPNGSGKSSFSRILCGLDDPLHGLILFDGQPLTSKELSRKIGYLFQNPDLQIFLPTVADELSWSMHHLGRSCQEAITLCAELFELDLDDTPTTMSYPQRKALQAAVYYLLDRPFYILDELDSALTYHSALSIIARLRRNGAGILLITHDRQFASKVSQRCYTISEGRLHRV
ncbi:MAG: ATP-binding cassette domain-containing protein, partial [Spirochaetia bacterium]|nr:ATP-binding cassette domain-containing protein [Spirochaetia bacterium]